MAKKVTASRLSGPPPSTPLLEFEIRTVGTQHGNEMAGAKAPATSRSVVATSH